MEIDVDQILKRAADFQRLVNPGDALSAITQELAEELDESALDRVAAAAQSVYPEEQQLDNRK